MQVSLKHPTVLKTPFALLLFDVLPLIELTELP